MTPIIAEIAASPDTKVIAYAVGGVLALGGLAIAVNALLKLFDRFRTPYASVQAFEDLRRRVENSEHRIEQVFERIDAVQFAMTEAAEARSRKMFDAVQDLKNHR